MQHAPKAVFAIGGADARCQPMQHFGGVSDGSNRHPIRRLGGSALALVSDRSNAMAHDNAILTANGSTASRLHGLDL